MSEDKSDSRPRITYAEAGVDIDAADAAKARIAKLVRGTYTDGVMGDFGQFGGCFRVSPRAGAGSGSAGDDGGAILVASADGVGTKIKVAVMADVHDTVGYDLVAHCADDILATGALPLFFLDYLALGRMEPLMVEQLVEGVARACRDVGCALLGGETAEMPDMYAEGEYDLAGFIVGQAVHPEPLDGSKIRPGDRLIGLASNGLHTNGYTLVRKILFEIAGLSVRDPMPGCDGTVGEELLRTHRSYVAALRPALERGDLLGLAHITGGGIQGNLPRMLPDGCDTRVDRSAWTVPPVFRTLQELGGVPDADMWRTFNMGIGMIAAVRPDRVEALTAEWREAGEEVFELGEVIEA